MISALAAGPVAADHFTSIDLGPVANAQACITQADATFNAYAARFGQAASTSRGTWTISGWDLPPVGADVTVLCVEVGGLFNAFATGYLPDPTGNGPTPEATVETIRDMFGTAK